jgi:CTP:phosphocholine cytidylyltransferase-like protein
MNLEIICAGESSRIKAEGWEVPKHMIKINGEYLIGKKIKIAFIIKAEHIISTICEKTLWCGSQGQLVILRFEAV